MKKIFILPLSLLFFASCKQEAKQEDNQKTKTTTVRDTTPKVTGIGGIFFKSKSAKATKEWYGKNLGLAITDWGSAFEFRNAHRPDEINYLSWGGV